MLKSNYTGVLPLWARIDWSVGIRGHRPNGLQQMDRELQKIERKLAGSAELIKPVCQKTWCGCKNPIN